MGTFGNVSGQAKRASSPRRQGGENHSTADGVAMPTGPRGKLAKAPAPLVRAFLASRAARIWSLITSSTPRPAAATSLATWTAFTKLRVASEPTASSGCIAPRQDQRLVRGQGLVEQEGGFFGGIGPVCDDDAVTGGVRNGRGDRAMKQTQARPVDVFRTDIRNLAAGQVDTQVQTGDGRQKLIDPHLTRNIVSPGRRTRGSRDRAARGEHQYAGRERHAGSLDSRGQPAQAAIRPAGKCAVDTLEQFLRNARGRLAQLVEHLVYTERVGGSSPSPPTISLGCNPRIP